VHPVLACSNESGSRSPIDSIEEIGRWLKKMTAVVVGPGLGRDDATLQVASAIMQKAREMDLPLVIDADGLHVVRLDPQLVKGYRRCILTPNANEFQRLRDALPADKTDPAAAGQPLSVVKENPQHPLPKITEEALSLTSALCRALDGVTIVRKGPSDCISDGRVGMVCAVTGASKRAGGQGDVLSGSAATFVSWAMRGTDEAEGPPRHLLACYGACALTRASAAAAFAKKRRSMTAPDVISELGEASQKSAREALVQSLSVRRPPAVCVGCRCLRVCVDDEWDGRVRACLSVCDLQWHYVKDLDKAQTLQAQLRRAGRRVVNG